jgi:SAM-dependent methyltransferase
MTTSNVNLWTSPDHAREYLGRADQISHRAEGEAALLEFIPGATRRILDLGTGDGRLLALMRDELARRGNATTEAVAIDFSPAMLEAAQKRFAGDPRVKVMAHNLDSSLPSLGKFDAMISSFAIHHLVHERKRALYAEILDMLEPGGVFAIWSTYRRPRRVCTKNFCCGSDLPSRRKIRQTSSWIVRPSSGGCGRLGLPTWIATGSGGNWRCWSGSGNKGSG